MNFRGTRLLNPAIRRSALIKAIEGEMQDLAATGIRIEAECVCVDRIRANPAKAQPFVLSKCMFKFSGEPLATSLVYTGTATARYTPRFLLALAVPLCLALGYALTVSPLVLWAVPVGLALLLFTHRPSVAIWLEELALRIENRATETPAN